MSNPSPHPSSPNRDQSIREYETWKAALAPLHPRCAYCGAPVSYGHRTCAGHRDLEGAA